MRIALVCGYSLSIPGGVQSQVMGLARVLRARGHEARVLAPCDGPPPAAWITPLGNSVPYAANGSVAPIAPDPSCVFRTIRAMRDETFDIVHLHEPLCPGPPLWALVTTDAPIIGTFHRSGNEEAYDKMRPAVLWAAKNLDLRCAVSEEAAQTAMAAMGGEYEIVFNGIEVARFRDVDSYPTDGPTVIFVGRHEPRKGLAVLLDAMAHLPPDARLWVAGMGPQTAELQAKAAGDPRITWLGSIPQTELARRLRGADVLCAPALGGESFGIVLLEGMAAECAVVAADIPGYHNAARPGIDAVYVEPNDPEALANGLSSVLFDDVNRKKFVEAGNKRVEEFSMDRLADCYLELYEVAATNHLQRQGKRRSLASRTWRHFLERSRGLSGW